MIKKTILICISVLAVGCVSLPDVYLIDRHTIMESESSGEWPELEKRFLDDKISAGPVPYEKDEKQQVPKAHILLNAELASSKTN